jgi:predicted CoA-binding protein
MLNIAVVGASPKEDRYSYKAMLLLKEKGYMPIPVAPAWKEILSLKVYTTLESISEDIDTVTMYVGHANQTAVIKGILAKKPRRVIFNPGTENPAVYDELKNAGIVVIEACTLVLLKTGQF